MRIANKLLFYCLIVALPLALQAQQTFTNPLLPSGADPWCLYKDGFYYYTNTTGRNITVWKTDNIGHLSTAEKKVIYNPPPNTDHSNALWAPEIHFLKGKWYIYFAADGGNNKDHRMWVIENASPDPLKGKWTLKPKLVTPDDKWSIDGTVYEHNKKLYFLWSGWEGDKNGQQDIFIAKMKNPWTIKGKRVRLSSPTFEWEMNGDLKPGQDVSHVNVNEGPQILENQQKLFLIYSANGCWTDNYSLGMLSIDADKNIMDSASWTKSPVPVFKQSPENGVYATGHNSFFKSPDGKEDWILYHANSKPGQGCGKARTPRAQKFSWKADGTPDFGVPVKEDTELPVPSNNQ